MLSGVLRAGSAPTRKDLCMTLWLAVACSLVFALTNGFHDAANAIATLVATRGAPPGRAVLVSAGFDILGALVVGLDRRETAL